MVNPGGPAVSGSTIGGALLTGSGIILASQSQSRRAMLDAAQIAYQAIPAKIDERALEAQMEGAPPEQIAQTLAEAKALAISSQMQEDKLVLGSDSLVCIDGKRFDKPRSYAEAGEHLRFFSGRMMALYSAAALALDGKIIWSTTEQVRLQVRILSEQFIAAYLDQEWPDISACVGVFRIEGLGAHLFDKIDGDQFSVLGMPLLAVMTALRELGVFEEAEELPQ